MSREVTAALEADLDWRVAELASLKINAASAQRETVAHQALLRALWALLYAHYEGFVKVAWDLHLDAIQLGQHPRNRLQLPIALFSLAKTFQTHQGDLSPRGIWSFHNATLPTAVSAPAQFDNRLDTQSNLWPQLLEENCATIGISIPSLQENYAKLRTLVGRRNEIAHGRRLVVNSIEDYDKYERAAFAVMYELAYEVHGLLESGGYLTGAPETRNAAGEAGRAGV